jgi:hypothetical protein
MLLPAAILFTRPLVKPSGRVSSRRLGLPTIAWPPAFDQQLLINLPA